jgi:hypothetical protein
MWKVMDAIRANDPGTSPANADGQSRAEVTIRTGSVPVGRSARRRGRQDTATTSGVTKPGKRCSPSLCARSGPHTKHAGNGWCTKSTCGFVRSSSGTGDAVTRVRPRCGIEAPGTSGRLPPVSPAAPAPAAGHGRRVCRPSRPAGRGVAAVHCEGGSGEALGNGRCGHASHRWSPRFGLHPNVWGRGVA